jgi:Leucine-rich repeat (LRR) protein
MFFELIEKMKFQEISFACERCLLFSFVAHNCHQNSNLSRLQWPNVTATDVVVPSSLLKLQALTSLYAGFVSRIRIRHGMIFHKKRSLFSDLSANSISSLPDLSQLSLLRKIDLSSNILRDFSALPLNLTIWYALVVVR